jgi:glycosyltransferase involved in cell wall biosynthesis
MESNRFRVAHICQSDDPNVGGSLSVARALVQEQRKLGLDARLVFLYRTASTSARPLNATDSLWCDVERKSRWLRGVPCLRRVLRQFDPAIIHHHDGILWPRLATMTTGRPLVTHGHLGLPTQGFFSPARLTQFVVKRTTDRLIAISEWVASSWERGGFPKERIRLIPNGVKTDCFVSKTFEEKQALRQRLGLPMDCRIVLWVGRLHCETKGLDRLAAIASVIRPPFHLVVVGDGPDRSWLEDKLKQIGREESGYTLVGKVTDPTTYFGAADMFLFTSKVEPFGLVLLEAAASGLPVFAFNCKGGGRDLLKKLKVTVTFENNAGWLVEQMRLLPDRTGTMEITKMVRLEFSWESAARKTVEMYQELLKMLRLDHH